MIIKCVLFLFSISFLSANGKPLFISPALKYELAVAAIFHNDARFLKEWIEFHKTVGVQHFYLYNNLSTDDFQTVLSPYIASGDIELFEWPYSSSNIIEWNSVQCACYMNAIEKGLKTSKWIAFIDTDEFIFPIIADSLPAFLKNYENVAAVSINWQCYGTSLIKKINDDQFMIELLTLKGETDNLVNFHVKSIVQPRYVIGCTSPHYFMLRPTYCQVTSSKIPFIGPFSPSLEITEARINHYWSRDEEFVENEKLQRQQVWVNSDRETLYDQIKILNLVEDKAIYPWLRKMKARLNAK